MKKWKIGSVIMLVILTLLTWFASGMFLSSISKWIHYPIAMIVFIVGLSYINTYYGKEDS